MAGNNENTRQGAIVGIPAEKIWQHPDNPRKDLGDLAELTESIKKNGIMQNLTVVPGHWEGDGAWKEDGYTLINGHRRCAAAKAAGMAELPCRIARGLSYKEQVAMMLEENMQRNDLTIWEQANGFQMMLDLGETEEKIAEKTGFSKTTIRHRLNIAKLDQDELRKKEQDDSFQLTLKDLYELEKIKDVGTRDKVLKESSDSRQLVWKAKEAARAEKRREKEERFGAFFGKAGIPRAPKGSEHEKYGGKWRVCQKWDLDKEDPPESLKNYGKDAMWTVFWGETAAIITPAKEEKEQQPEYERKRKEKEKAKKELRQKQKAMYEGMRRFIRGITTGEIAPLKESVEFYRELLAALAKARPYFHMNTLTQVYAGKDPYELENKEPEEYEKFLEWKKGLTPTQEAIAYMYGVRNNDMFGYNMEYWEEKAAEVKAVVAFLEKYGFAPSEEGRQVIEGTHELYRKEGGAED